MKLHQLLTEIFRNGPISNQYGNDYLLVGNELELRKDLLMACDEFKQLNSLSFTRLPTFVDNNQTTKTVQTIKLFKDTVFKGNFTLYSIGLTHEMFNMTFSKMYKKIPNNDAVTTPTFYNPETFTPIKYIIVPYSPEMSQDVSNIPNDYNDFKKKLHEKLDQVIENPNDHQLKGVRNIIIRGVIDLTDCDSSILEEVYL